MIPTMCFENRPAAEQAVALLSDRRIKADIHTATARVTKRQYFPVYLREEDLEEALECVGNANIPGTVKCQECHSINVEFPQAPQASAGFHAMAKLGELLGSEKSFYCHGCRNLWTEHEAPGAEESPVSGKA